MDTFPQPPKLSLDSYLELETWAEIDPDGIANEMEALGAQRNVIRHAEGWGPGLVARLAAAGLLNPGQDPLEALEALIETAEGAVEVSVETQAAPEMKEIDFDSCDHMPIQEFIDCVDSGGFTDDDGFGRYATATHESDVSARPSEIAMGIIERGFTHICWYNK